MKAWLLLVAVIAGPAAAQPRESLVSTRLSVAGEVRQELSLTVDGLRAFARERGMVEQRGYAGVRLADLLQQADIRQDARHALRRTYVVASARDGYVAVFSWGELFNSALGAGVLVVFGRDGEPLRDGEGDIALISLADQRPGARHVKWLSKIEVRRIPD